MAKKEAQELDAPVEVPAHLKNFNFDEGAGESFGGSSEILMLAEDEVAGPLTYVTLRRGVDLGNNMGLVDIHEAKDSEGDLWRLPIASNFRRQAESANLRSGDVFGIKRLLDATKKHGKGKGNAMEMYAIKIVSRAPVAPSMAVS